VARKLVWWRGVCGLVREVPVFLPFLVDLGFVGLEGLGSGR
jgi:hypothetical protein